MKGCPQEMGATFVLGHCPVNIVSRDACPATSFQVVSIFKIYPEIDDICSVELFTWLRPLWYQVLILTDSRSVEPRHALRKPRACQ